MNYRKLFIATICFCSCLCTFGQNVNTLYFMDEISTRNLLNPAFLPRCKSYFDFILLPNVYVGTGENAVAIKDLIYRKNDDTPANLFSTPASINEFLTKLSSSPYAKADVRLNILNFGARVNPYLYFLFDMNLRVDVKANIPKDLFKFILRGSSGHGVTDQYDLHSLDVYADVYASVGFGFAGRIGKKVTYGIKPKFLLGFAHVQSQINKFNLTTSSDAWTVNSESYVNAYSPVEMVFVHNSDGAIDFGKTKFGLIKPAGFGASFDIGITYEPIPYLTFSAAVVDLGFISWKGFKYKGILEGEYKYSGLGNIKYGDDVKLDSKALDELGDQIWRDFTIAEEQSSDIQMVNGKFNCGIEYGVLKNKISFGIMNQLAFKEKTLYDEFLLAVNFRPGNVFKASFSYSFINGHWGSIGAGININFGGFCWYVISDYVPITYTRVVADKNNIILPDRIEHFNIQTGVVFNIRRFERDLDDDGVVNKRDYCKNTDMELLRTKCPKMSNKELVDKFGCELDEDKDGVNDCFDQCPGTPFGIKVDEYGCPLDSDHDGVPDSIDKCPDTPEEAEVDSLGCPVDSDHDGIPDYIDKCPSTPRNALVDSLGCPIDSDRDGVPDYMDKCLDTPSGIQVDSLGCPIDSDKDGVPDYLDKCPMTPNNVEVDSLGCPIDSDHDSIPDYLDRCPDRPGPVSNDGCPELVEAREIFRQAMNGIQFMTKKSDIMEVSFPILDQIVSLMNIDTTYNVEINGHTDNVGDPEANMILSQERAAAVRQYLIEHGINSNRITSNGYGDTQPVADNQTAEGRAKNRRVEFNIVYERVTYKSEDETDK